METNLPSLPGNNNMVPETINQFDQLIDRFMANQDLKPASKNRYRKSLRVYFNWVKESGYELGDIRYEQLLIYKAWLFNQKTKDGTLFSSFTISAYINALKSFYKWANSIGLLFNPAGSLKAPEKEKGGKFEREPLTAEQAKKLLEHFSLSSPRDFAICSLMLRCGLRTIEITRLDVEDVQFKSDKRILMVQGKGKDRKDRYVLLSDKAFIPLNNYLNGRTTGVMFTSESITGVAGRLIPGTISKIIKKGLRAIGINHKKFTAHSLRHTAGTTAIKAGASIGQVQDMLRHADSKTTEGYLKTILEENRLKNSAEGLLDDAF